MQYVLWVALMFGMTACGGGDGTGSIESSKGPSSSSSRGGLVSYGSRDVSVQKVDIKSVGYITTEGTAVDIALSEDGMVAYLASGEGGLEVIDISIPEHPRLLESYDVPEYVNYVKVVNNRVYVANMLQRQEQYFKLYAFDIYDPYRPRYVGYDNGQNGVGHSRVKMGNYLYEVGQEGISIHRAINSVYYPVGSHYIHGTSYALAVRGEYLFVANGRDGLRVFRTSASAHEGRVR